MARLLYDNPDVSMPMVRKEASLLNLEGKQLYPMTPAPSSISVSQEGPATNLRMKHKERQDCIKGNVEIGNLENHYQHRSPKTDQDAKLHDIKHAQVVEAQ